MAAARHVESGAAVRLVNRTAAPVLVHEPHTHDVVFSLAPLETRTVPAAELATLGPLLTRWESRRVLATTAIGAGERAATRTERGPAGVLPWGLATTGIAVPAAFLVASLGSSLQSAPFVARTFVLLAFVSLASLLPAAMYLQFDRQRLSGLAYRWLFDIFRLDRSLTTLDDVKARYGSLVGDFYGGILEGDDHIRPTNARIRTPVVVATACVTLGWLLALGPALAPDGASPALGFGWVRVEISPAAVGFLGSYVFALMTVLRGYQRGDLRPKTYMTVSQRVFVVTALCWVLQVVWPAASDNAVLLAGCFVAGLVPETALAGIQRRAAISPIWFTPNGGLLSDLDGMDLYDESRLREEGITCVQAFAKHSFVELTLSTRIPVARLVDWLDQAVLRLHTGADLAGVLAQAGVRTATEFLVVHDGGAAFGAPDLQGRLAVLALALRGDDHTQCLVDWKQPARSPVTGVLAPAPTTVREPVDNGLVPKPVPA